MAKIDRPTIIAGNDTTLYIQLKEFVDGEYVDVDLTRVSNLKVELLCARDNYKYEIPYRIDDTYKNLIICDLKYTYYHSNTSYGIIVTGTNLDEKHWTWCMMPREGFNVVSNTSGLHLTDEAQQLSFNGLVGWGIQTDADLTNYYTKIEVNNLLDEKADESELANKQDELVSGTNIKTINSQSLLGSGNMVIEGTEQLQSDWTQTDTSAKDYIKNKPTIPAAQVNSDWNATSGVAKILNKPDLNNYATKTDLNNYYDKGQTDGLLNNKVDVSTLNSDYYNKNTVDNLLDAKVDTSDLAQVATSGSYNDLTNKPDLSVYATHTELNTKQDTLVSGTNIKTINNESILGSGNINIDAENNDEVTANALYDINQRLSEAEFGVKSIPQDIDAKIVPVNEKIDEVSNDVIDLTNDIDNTNLANSLILNELHNEIDDKQDELVSGTNIKTVNGTSLLGSGDITVGGGVQSDWNESDTTSLAYIQNKPTIPTEAKERLLIDYDIDTVNDRLYLNLCSIAADGSIYQPNQLNSFSTMYSNIMTNKNMYYSIWIDNTLINTTDFNNAVIRSGRDHYLQLPATISNVNINYGSEIKLNIGNNNPWSRDPYQIISISLICNKLVTSTTNGLKLQTASSAPSGTVPVTLAFDSTTNTLYIVQ